MKFSSQLRLSMGNCIIQEFYELMQHEEGWRWGGGHKIFFPPNDRDALQRLADLESASLAFE